MMSCMTPWEQIEKLSVLFSEMVYDTYSHLILFLKCFLACIGEVDSCVPLVGGGGIRSNLHLDLVKPLKHYCE